MTKKFKVIAANGIHAKPATLIVNEAYKYQSTDIEIGLNNTFVDMKSIIGVMSLGIYTGSIIEIRAIGEEEQEAIDGLTSLLIQNKWAKNI